MSKIINYFTSAWNEAKKVSWPTKKQTLNYSMLVIALSVGFALFFVALDYVFNFGLEKLISR
jgi:preprotein translocase subunit SecE